MQVKSFSFTCVVVLKSQQPRKEWMTRDPQTKIKGQRTVHFWLNFICDAGDLECIIKRLALESIIIRQVYLCDSTATPHEPRGTACKPIAQWVSEWVSAKLKLNTPRRGCTQSGRTQQCYYAHFQKFQHQLYYHLSVVGKFVQQFRKGIVVIVIMRWRESLPFCEFLTHEVKAYALSAIDIEKLLKTFALCKPIMNEVLAHKKIKHIFEMDYLTQSKSKSFVKTSS